jgi:L,D-peptidoglycan transpeptidase YkuD (ErfK/YbiS/YcfS/YnhG family)
MDLVVTADGWARFGERRVKCAVGRAGVSIDKHEGDGATPVGAWPCRTLYFRPDRLTLPKTGLAVTGLSPTDGWCDDPRDVAYNKPVRRPYPASAEALWREDRVYDLIVPLGYNDAPVSPGRGSAIFLHLAREHYEPTEGCVALALADLIAFLALADPGSRVIVHPYEA